MQREYVKKPIPIKAIEIKNWVMISKITDDTPGWLAKLIADDCFEETPDGGLVFMCGGNTSKFELGDYVIHGVLNDNYICPREVFKATYEEYIGR